MPNICLGNIAIKGYHSNVDALVKILQADYNYNDEEFLKNPHLHFYRVFDCYVTSEETHNLQKIVTCEIECAWSVAVCLFNGPLSYYDDAKDLVGRYHTHIQEQARRLGVLVEIYSEEYDIGFAEHYIVDNHGYMVANECVDAGEIYIGDYEDYDDFKDDLCEYPDIIDQIPEERFNDAKTHGCDGVDYSGFGDYDFAIDDYKNMANVVIAKKVK